MKDGRISYYHKMKVHEFESGIRPWRTSGPATSVVQKLNRRPGPRNLFSFLQQKRYEFSDSEEDSNISFLKKQKRYEFSDSEDEDSEDEDDEEEGELPAKLAYLLCGHFETNEKDKKGWDATRW